MAPATRHRVLRLVSLIVGSLVAAALGGVLGLLAYLSMRRRGTSVVGRSRLRFAAVGLAVLVLAAGFTVRATTALVPVAACQAPTDATTDATLTPPPPPAKPAPTPIHAIEAIATAAPTGLAIVYAAAAGADLCVSPEGFYIAERDQGFVSTVGKGALIGDVFLSWKLPEDRNPALARHEARHSAQWTVATLVGGPLAFPAAYQAVDFFFPGARNPFERDAGLAIGDYDPNTPFAPVFGTPQILLLALFAAGTTWFIVRKIAAALTAAVAGNTRGSGDR